MLVRTTSFAVRHLSNEISRRISKGKAPDDVLNLFHLDSTKFSMENLIHALYTVGMNNKPIRLARNYEHLSAVISVTLLRMDELNDELMYKFIMGTSARFVHERHAERREALKPVLSSILSALDDRPLDVPQSNCLNVFLLFFYLMLSSMYI